MEPPGIGCDDDSGGYLGKSVSARHYLLEVFRPGLEIAALLEQDERLDDATRILGAIW
jgi:hypothetical protein